MTTLKQDLQVHITWDTEPTEKAKDFIRTELYKALQETFQESSWFREVVQAEVQAELRRIREG